VSIVSVARHLRLALHVLDLQRARGLLALVEAGLLAAERQRGRSRKQQKEEDPHGRY
jgi:hypothetical protein